MLFESKQAQKTWFTKRVVFFQTANLSDIYVGNIRLVLRVFFGPTYSTICPIYKSDISYVYIGLIIVQISSKNRGHKIVFFQKACGAPLEKKTILSDLFCACILVRLRVHFVRYISRTFPIYISDKLWPK